MDEFYRIKRLPPYVFAIVNDLKTKARARGEDVIDLGMGNPDLPTPKHIVAKLIEAAQNPKNHRYSASRGITRLRVAIAKWYRDRYGVELDPDSETIATIGAKEGLAHLALRSEEHTSELQLPYDLVCRLLLEKKKKRHQRQRLPSQRPRLAPATAP